jgi:hypothetical protein
MSRSVVGLKAKSIRADVTSPSRASSVPSRQLLRNDVRIIHKIKASFFSSLILFRARTSMRCTLELTTSCHPVLMTPVAAYSAVCHCCLLEISFGPNAMDQ